MWKIYVGRYLVYSSVKWMHHQRWGGGGGVLKWWILEYKMTYFNFNFMFLLSNHKSDDNWRCIYAKVVFKKLCAKFEPHEKKTELYNFKCNFQ